MKVVLICHFSNKEIQSILKPFKQIGEFAPWIPSIIEIFEDQKEIEYHIVSPHLYINRYKKFKLRSINYHFYNAHMPLIGRNWPGSFKWDLMTDFKSNKRIVNKIVNAINPDIVHLFGAENAYYSSTVLQFREFYPILVSVQGFVFKSSSKRTAIINKRIGVEHEIITRINSQAVHTENLKSDILKFNPNARIYFLKYPVKIPKVENVLKKFDLVFFARICKDKGIEDLLQALSIVKKSKQDINLCVIGGGNYAQFETLANELGLKDNVTWAGFLPTQEDVHKMASTAKISVLPTYHDIISGTIIESLFLKLPVVAYNVGSIHEVNKHEEIISLVEKFDLEGLAKSILELLNNENLQKERAEKGYQRAIEMFDADNDTIREDLLKAYKGVIEDFHNMQDRR